MHHLIKLSQSVLSIPLSLEPKKKTGNKTFNHIPEGSYDFFLLSRNFFLNMPKRLVLLNTTLYRACKMLSAQVKYLVQIVS